jgi:hypothetical protein
MLLSEIHRVMKPGSRLIITVPNWFDIIAVRILRQSPEHLQTRAPFGWKKILEKAHFDVEFWNSIRFPFIDSEFFNKRLPLFGMCIIFCLKKA